MSTVLNVNRTFTGTGDARQETWGYVVEFNDMVATAVEARVADDGTTVVVAEGTILAGTTWRAEVSAKQREDEPTFWDVTAVFKQPDAGGAERKPEGTGVKWNIKVDAKAQAYERPAMEGYKDGDFDAKVPIRNSAGYTFGHEPTYNDYDTVWTISFNADDGSIIDLLREKVGLVNSDDDGTITFTYKGVQIVFDQYKLRLVDYAWGFDHAYASNGSDEAFAVSMTFHERSEGLWWDVEAADKGFLNIAGVPFKDAHNNEKGEPTQLDGSGGELTSGTAVPLRWDVRLPVEFASLFVGL